MCGHLWLRKVLYTDVLATVSIPCKCNQLKSSLSWAKPTQTTQNHTIYLLDCVCVICLRAYFPDPHQVWCIICNYSHSCSCMSIVYLLINTTSLSPAQGLFLGVGLVTREMTSDVTHSFWVDAYMLGFPGKVWFLQLVTRVQDPCKRGVEFRKELTSLSKSGLQDLSLSIFHPFYVQ